MCCRFLVASVVIHVLTLSACADDWTFAQSWQKDSDAPVIGLGDPGAFDDMHLFAPCVAYENGVYTLWYCGSRGDVANRVFEMGMATSADGVHFDKRSEPVFAFGDGKHSILTPTLLRGEDGAVLREDGKLRMWFAATDFTDGTGLHTLHETASTDGIAWDAPSEPQLEHVYAPTVIKDGGAYLMWYTDVSGEPWVIRHARSNDGKAWRVMDEVSIAIDQPWEEKRLFYPTVIKSGGTYCMWYGAYWTARANTTAIGFATSRDGVTWTKHEQNPVLMPSQDRPWESHYTTSQSVIRFPDGSLRMWYATREAPPFVHKYFAIGTAKWEGPPRPSAALPWNDRGPRLREAVRTILTWPEEKIPLDASVHRTLEGDGYTIESISFAAEPASRVTALLHKPSGRAESVPAVIVACGHGGSKSALYAQYAGQLYAKRGFACLVVDTIGEEERNAEGRMGARGHDLYRMKHEERLLFERRDFPRSVLGKIVFDLSRGIDYLESRKDIDATRIGVTGYSLGGATAGCLAIADDRVKAAVITGWGFTPLAVEYGKECSRLPYEDIKGIMGWHEMTALAAQHAAVLFLNGENDSIIDHRAGGAALKQYVTEYAAQANALFAANGGGEAIKATFVPDACHRPYFLAPEAVQWMEAHLMKPEERSAVPMTTINYGVWVDSQGQTIEKLYNTEARERGLMAVDIGAVYRDPKRIACFPDEPQPTDEYTFEGWVANVQRTE